MPDSLPYRLDRLLAAVRAAETELRMLAVASPAVKSNSALSGWVTAQLARFLAFENEIQTLIEQGTLTMRPGPAGVRAKTIAAVERAMADPAIRAAAARLRGKPTPAVAVKVGGIVRKTPIASQIRAASDRANR